MFALGIQIVFLLVSIGLPILLAVWLVRTLGTLSSVVRDIDAKLARIEDSLAQASIIPTPGDH